MKRIKKTSTPKIADQKGWTLIELIAVVAMVAFLATAIGLGVSAAWESVKKTKAQSDVTMIKTAILAFYSAVGEYPNRRNSRQSRHDWENRYKLLFSAPPDVDNPGFNDYAPDISAKAGDSFKVAANETDDLANHLLKTQGRGYSPRKLVKPFVEGLDVDPWGASYLVNIRNLDLNLDVRNLESDQPYDRHHAMVISAGPNGIIETPDTTKSNEQALQPGGDDIIDLIE